MNCEQARDLAVLAASGDVTAAEHAAMELHNAACAACLAECLAEASVFEELRGQLAAMRGESVPEHVYAAVRTRVAGEINEHKRPGWVAAWPAFVAVLACSVMLVVLLRPEAPVAIPRPIPQTPVLETPEITPAVTETSSVPPPPRRVHSLVAKAVPRESNPPVTVQMLTNDPNVVIYWIADARPTRTDKETMQ